MSKQAANIITSLRIVCAALMACFPALSPRFYAAYLLGGVSDMADGAIARKMGAATAFGAKFDAAADLIFVSVALAKLLPAARVPRWLRAWVAIIAAAKIRNIIAGFAYHKRLIVAHTALNKMTGFALFILPFALPFIGVTCASIAACAMATLAAVQEGRYMKAGREVR